MRNGKPFCFKYIKDLKKREQSNTDKINEVDMNSLYNNFAMTTQSSDNEYLNWLGDTGAQCHVRMTIEKSKSGSVSSVTMGNNTGVNVLRRESFYGT